MRRTLLSLTLSCTVLLAACGERSQRTTGPRLFADASTGSCSSVATDTSAILVEIDALFDSGNQNAVETRYLHIVDLMSPPSPYNPDSAESQAMALIGYTLDKYSSGLLNAGVDSVDVAQFINALLCTVGLPPTFDPTFSAAAVITPTTPDTAVTTENKWAGVFIPTGSVTQPVLITITRLPDSPGPLFTQLDQYPLFYQFDVTPKPASGDDFEKYVTVGVCQAASATPPDKSRLRLGHNIPTNTIEILPFAEAGFLDCTDADIVATGPAASPLLQFARAGWRTVRPVLSSIFLPERLLAFATSGTGGTTRNFSPFGAVDTLLIMTPNSATSQAWTLGGTIPSGSLPSVKVLTPTGKAVDTLPVTFAVTAGGGSITGASTRTDANGIATLGGWTLGASALVNSVSAKADPPHLRSGVENSPMTFTAYAASTLLKVSTDPQTATAGTAVAVPPKVQVVGPGSVGVKDVSVTFTVLNGGGTVTAPGSTTEAEAVTVLTDANGYAAVGSWTVGAGTNQLDARTDLTPSLTGEPATFTATGTTSTTPYLACTPSNGAGDALTRAFYYPIPTAGNRPSSVSKVSLYLSTNAPANALSSYTIELIATANSFAGTELGRSSQTVYLRGNASQNLPTDFTFAGGLPLKTSGISTLAFQFHVVSNESGATLTFNTGSCGVGDTKCKSRCPVVETIDASSTSTSPLSTFRRQGIGISLW